MSHARFSDWASLSSDARREIAKTVGARASPLEPRLHAFVTIEEPVSTSTQSGPLATLPYAVKDMFAAPNHQPSGGLAAAVGPTSGYADVLRRLDEAGACRIGFTAMTELAYEPSGYNASTAYPLNPWDWSSSRAGRPQDRRYRWQAERRSWRSVRIPEGRSAFRPTAPVSPAGSQRGGPSLQPAPCRWRRFLNSIGLLARSAADLSGAAAALSATARPRRAIERIVVFSDALETAEPSVRRACRDGIDALQACAISVSAVPGLPSIEWIDAHALRVMQGEAARIYADRLHHPAINATLRKRLERGLTINDAALSESRAARASLAMDFEATVLGRADAAILPVMPIRIPPYREVDPASPSFSSRRLYELSNYCRFVNMLGFPAVAIPVGLDDRGLPVGLQIIGRPNHDGDLIELATQMQSKTDWHGRIPAAVRDLVDPRQGLLA